MSWLLSAGEEKKELLACRETKAFLGREFLTWLWFSSEGQEQDLIQLGKRELAVHYWVDDRLALQSYDERGYESLLKGGDPSRSAEAATSLQAGRVVKEMKLGLHVHPEGDFFAQLTSEAQIRSLVLPPLTDEETEGGVEATVVLLERRLELLSLFSGVFDALFQRFYDLRCQQRAWETEVLPEMRAWVKQRLDP